MVSREKGGKQVEILVPFIGFWQNKSKFPGKTRLSSRRLSTVSVNESQKSLGIHISAIHVVTVSSVNPMPFLFGFYVLAISKVTVK